MQPAFTPTKISMVSYLSAILIASKFEFQLHINVTKFNQYL